ncbi:hypothetical protein DL95DRAFT_133052 [Leptodontidium sp. 2 PMI_412]|nr:hypothetical protein DL95DRAFT_133052 [Leptodontidium sp. 2 PMI_412]
MATINGVTGAQFPKGSDAYASRKYQYATSSHEVEHRMDPALIIYPSSKEDIAAAIKYAKASKIAIAIRTGGHQYSGASSTAGPNIQLDLRKTFRGPDDRRLFVADGQTYVRTSVSWGLEDFNKYLGDRRLFVPHGQCVNVHLGGHVQTGGWGQLGRSFGLFGDHVVSVEIVDHQGSIKEVTPASDKELFWAILGGSPGNLGVLTHFTIKVHRDQDYQGSLGLKSLFWYDPKTLKRLLDILVEMSDNEDFPGNYDYCVSVLSSANKLLDWFPEIDGQMRRDHPELYGDDDVPFWPRSIVVYAQWVPLAKGDKPDMSWFERIRKGSVFNLPVEKKPMSELTTQWLFQNVREFDKPYVKSTQVTNSKTLGADGWAAWVTGRIDAIVKPEKNRCWLSCQFQCFGGKNSKFVQNGENGTSYSWRDTTVCATMDCFHDPEFKQRAEDWQLGNHQGSVGPNGKFSKDDRRLLWGSWGNFDLDAVWSCYYEDQEKYDRLRKVRMLADPDGVFTPNTFSVKRE